MHGYGTAERVGMGARLRNVSSGNAARLREHLRSAVCHADVHAFFATRMICSRVILIKRKRSIACGVALSRGAGSIVAELKGSHAVSCRNPRPSRRSSRRPRAARPWRRGRRHQGQLEPFRWVPSLNRLGQLLTVGDRHERHGDGGAGAALSSERDRIGYRHGRCSFAQGALVAQAARWLHYAQPMAALCGVGASGSGRPTGAGPFDPLPRIRQKDGLHVVHSTERILTARRCAKGP
jgi:hypothetical protein